MRLVSVILAVLFWATSISAQNAPLRIEITEGVIEPLTFAVPAFQAETPDAAGVAQELASVIASDLTGTGLFREIPASSFIAQRVDAIIVAPVVETGWRPVLMEAARSRIPRSARLGEKTDLRFRKGGVGSRQASDPVPLSPTAPTNRCERELPCRRLPT